MISEETLRKAVSRLVEVARPSKVILFGSYATGKANEDSDLDIMVIEPTRRDAGQNWVALRDAIGDVGTGVDVLVFSEEETNQRGQVPGTVIYWALKEGRVMYEAEVLSD